jgi:hypothetical protein
MIGEQIRHQQIGRLINGLGQSFQIGETKHTKTSLKNFWGHTLQMMCQDNRLEQGWDLAIALRRKRSLLQSSLSPAALVGQLIFDTRFCIFRPYPTEMDLN